MVASAAGDAAGQDGDAPGHHEAPHHLAGRARPTTSSPPRCGRGSPRRPATWPSCSRGRRDAGSRCRPARRLQVHFSRYGVPSTSFRVGESGVEPALASQSPASGSRGPHSFVMVPLSNNRDRRGRAEGPRPRPVRRQPEGPTGGLGARLRQLWSRSTSWSAGYGRVGSLVAGLGPGRSMACSIVSVVRTRSTTGCPCRGRLASPRPRRCWPPGRSDRSHPGSPRRGRRRRRIRRGRQAGGHQRQLERARHPCDGQRALVDTVADEGVGGTGQQPLGDRR